MNVPRESPVYGADLHGVRQMIVYGIKGMSTYYKHALSLGQSDPVVPQFVHEVSGRIRSISVPVLDPTR